MLNDYQDIQNASSWEQLPKIWDSETFDFIEPGTLERFRCEDGYQYLQMVLMEELKNVLYVDEI